MDGTSEAATAPGPNQAISRGVVHVFKEYLGRGPTKTRTHIQDNVVTCILSDSLTRAEKALVERGDVEAVRAMRRKFQDTMRADLVALVETTLQRKVTALLSDNHVDPDIAVETFVLEAVASDGGQPQ